MDSHCPFSPLSGLRGVATGGRCIPGGSFASELTDEAGHTFSHTVDGAGTTKYSCTPHEVMGMKGEVVVE
ncbi:MAG: plastocyanin/azurin family copper-binding protein [Halolamina sp.]